MRAGPNRLSIPDMISQFLHLKKLESGSIVLLIAIFRFELNSKNIKLCVIVQATDRPVDRVGVRG